MVSRRLRGDSEAPTDARGGLAPGGDERAQIMLVGAIALAVLIVALVPVYNAVFTTDSAGVGDPEGVPDAASSYERTTLEAAQRIAVRTGHTRAYDDDASAASAFEPAFGNYTRLHGEAAVAGTGTDVNTTFDPSAPGTLYGVRIVQNWSGDVDKPTPGSPQNWHVVRNSSRARLGWFTARLDVSNLSESDPFSVRVHNGTDSVRLTVESDGGSSDVSVRLTGDVGAMSEDVTCDSRAGEVVIDLYRGSADRGDCTFTGLDVLEGPVSVWVRNGSSAYGVYELVLRDGDGLEPSIDKCTNDHTDPCWSPALWQLSVTTRVRSGGTDYASRVNVSVYGTGGD